MLTNIPSQRHELDFARITLTGYVLSKIYLDAAEMNLLAGNCYLSFSSVKNQRLIIPISTKKNRSLGGFFCLWSLLDSIGR